MPRAIVLGRLRRGHPLVYWLLTAVLATVTVLALTGLTRSAREIRAGYGTRQAVAVARRDLPIGHVIAAADVELRALPAAVLPDGALATLPLGRTTAAAVMRGETLVAARMAPAGAGPVAALVPAGRLGIAVPVPSGTLRVAVADRVDVLATVDPKSTTAAPTIVVATGAAVIDVQDASVTIAVTPAEAARVAFAESIAAVSVVLDGPDQRAPDNATTSTTTPSATR